LDIHPLVLDVAAGHIDEGVAGWDAHQSAVVLVGRGSTDPDANSDLYKVARLLQDMTGAATVEPAFVSLTPPSIPDALDRCRRLGAAAIAVVPYFLFAGVLVDRIGDQVRAWQAAAAGPQALVTRHLGPEPGIARLVLERYQEAVAGDARMNCDCCVHRLAAFQGSASDIVGEPERRVRFLE